MHIVKLEAENFKILRAVEITTDGNIVTIGGDNGQGKSSVLDAIWVALKGRGVAPPIPIRKGEEQCRIRVDLGELVISRTFTAKEGGEYTDSVKVESADGKQRFNSPQTMLNELMGQLGFDPLGFVQMDADRQAQTLLQMVPLPIDLDEVHAQYSSDYQNRRDVNRDVAQLEAQIAAIPAVEDLPDEVPDRQKLLDLMGRAVEHNSELSRQAAARQNEDWQLKDYGTQLETIRARIEELKAGEGNLMGAEAKLKKEIESRKPLENAIDVEKLRTDLNAAEVIQAQIEQRDRRAHLVQQLQARRAESDAFTDAMAKRDKAVQDALAKAKMPIDGLGFAVNEKGKPVVEFRGLPFEQASTAEQIRASTAIAMAGNPELRVLRIKDGSLLDNKSLKIITDMAESEDFQLWIEVVGDGGVGIVIEDGSVRGQELQPQPDKPKAKAKKADAPEEGKML